MRAARRWALAIGLTGLPIAPSARPPVRPSPFPVHNKHVSHTRVALDGVTVLARVRLFRDDLEKALGRKVAADDPASRAAIQAYVGKALVLRADGAPVALTVVDEDADLDEDQPVWWVLLQGRATRTVTSLGVRDELLFETFADQQNLLIVARQPGDERRSLHFQAGDRREQVVSFPR